MVSRETFAKLKMFHVEHI